MLKCFYHEMLFFPRKKKSKTKPADKTHLKKKQIANW